MGAYRPKSAKAHVIYKNAKGKRLPGVTTIVGQRAKHLENWVAKLVKEGYDYQEFMRSVANVGKCFHARSMADIAGIPYSPTDFTPDEVKASEPCYTKLLELATTPSVDMTIIEYEVEMVSEEMQVGGTMDLLIRWGGQLGVADLKSSDSGIYLDSMYQVVAYTEIAIENGYKPEFAVVINSPKDKEKALSIAKVNVGDKNYRRLVAGFKALRDAYSRDYDLKKALGVR